jgi:hypothetical protein
MKKKRYFGDMCGVVRLDEIKELAKLGLEIQNMVLFESV